jgi:hypothetical protein
MGKVLKGKVTFEAKYLKNKLRVTKKKFLLLYLFTATTFQPLCRSGGRFL